MGSSFLTGYGYWSLVCKPLSLDPCNRVSNWFDIAALLRPPNLTACVCLFSLFRCKDDVVLLLLKGLPAQLLAEQDSRLATPLHLAAGLLDIHERMDMLNTMLERCVLGELGGLGRYLLLFKWASSCEL